MATKSIDFIVSGDPQTARATVERALMDRKFQLTWQDDTTGVAERGSRIAYFFLGAFAQYFKIGVHLEAAGTDETTVRIERQSSGLMGGAIGASRTKRNMSSLQAELQATFSSAGVLHSVSEK